MTIDADPLHNFETRLVALLDEVRAATQASPRAAVNPDGTPGNVAAGELIDAAWGNSVVDTLVRRDGVIASHPGQSVAAGSLATLAWFSVTPSLDYGAGPVFTVPANRDGIYTATLAVSGPVLSATETGGIQIIVNGVPFFQAISPGQNKGTVSYTGVIEAGQPVHAQVYNPTAFAQNYAAGLNLFRVAL